MPNLFRTNTSIIALGLLSISLISNATEPLHDILRVGDSSGILMPEKCCWVQQPESPQIRKLQEKVMREYCSAIGGPVGTYEIRGNRLMLLAMRTCGGSIPVQELLPELPSPAPATWVTGKFTVLLDRQCFSPEGTEIYKTMINLSVADGVILSMREEQGEVGRCAR